MAVALCRSRSVSVQANGHHEPRNVIHFTRPSGRSRDGWTGPHSGIAPMDARLELESATLGARRHRRGRRAGLPHPRAGVVSPRRRGAATAPRTLALPAQTNPAPTPAPDAGRTITPIHHRAGRGRRRGRRTHRRIPGCPTATICPRTAPARRSRRFGHRDRCALRRPVSAHRMSYVENHRAVTAVGQVHRA